MLSVTNLFITNSTKGAIMKITRSKNLLTIETRNGGYRNRITITELSNGLMIKQFGRNVILSVDGFAKKQKTGKSRHQAQKTCASLECHYK
jgi:hypothetical protein